MRGQDRVGKNAMAKTLRGRLSSQAISAITSSLFKHQNHCFTPCDTYQVSDAASVDDDDPKASSQVYDYKTQKTHWPGLGLAMSRFEGRWRNGPTISQISRD